MTSENWSDAENDMIVAAWFTMLGVARRFDVAGRDARNRTLGHAGRRAGIR